MRDEEIVARFQTELALVQPHVTSALNGLLTNGDVLPCWWNGQAGLLDDPLAEGVIRRDGSIHLSPANYDSPARWRRYIHEMIHAHSDMKDRSTGGFEGYAANRGWEEAIVEYLQRHIRTQVLTPLGVDPNASEIREADRVWRYNGYIEAMEQICLMAGVANTDAPAWCAEMLRVPVAERSFGLMRKMIDTGDMNKIKKWFQKCLSKIKQQAIRTNARNVVSNRSRLISNRR